MVDNETANEKSNPFSVNRESWYRHLHRHIKNKGQNYNKNKRR